MDVLHPVLLLVQVMLAIALASTCACRLVKMDSKTIREIRWAFWFETIAALLVLGAPAMPVLWHQYCRWAPGTTPLAIWLLLLLAAVLVQVVTARYWHAGVPRQFQEKDGEH